MSRRAARNKSETGEQGGAFRRFCLRAAWLCIAWGATVMFLIGIPMRLVKDDIDALAVLFYATPLALLSASGFIAAWYWRARTRFALALLILAVICTGAWIWTGFRLGAEGRGGAQFRVAFWNCMRPGWRLRGILPMAQSWRADFAAFAESRPGGALSPRWQEAFPNAKVMPLTRELLTIGAEGTEEKSSGTLGGVGEFHLLRTTLGGREVFVLVVDFNGLATESRRPGFERLYQLVDAFSTQPLIVMGDFNTPGDSVHFSRLRSRLTDAFENAGTGTTATWPMVLPVLSLDHILVNKHLRIVKAEHHTSIYSDHRAVVADLAWP